ncbi:hypothetical protein [Candidatus Absconditicoccus praedator]|uniref:hypothetical protein n=1 Tax=Candidatus Absconditicoccus praedator TaxID=2735562 RepID=UPI001E511B4A|nr:hypothetical protein [Candidatus Absconditicoccus praedator]UFX82609.1 hypothetical protein HLG78_00450 [Candidatus Absconditicoccus praedator]
MESVAINSGINSSPETFENEIFIDNATGEVLFSYSMTGKDYNISPIKHCLNLSGEERDLVSDMEDNGYVVVGRLSENERFPAYIKNLNISSEEYFIQGELIFLDKHLLYRKFGYLENSKFTDRVRDFLLKALHR